MSKSTNKQIPELFLQIIRKRIADYIDKEIKVQIAKETDKIISDVLTNLQCDAELFWDMQSYETKLVVKAIYNGENIQQKESV